MKTKIINFTKTFKSIDAYIDQYNQGKSNRECIKLGERVLAKELCKIYTAMLSRRRNTRVLNDELPSLRTNNVQLSQRVYKSTRTIQTYIKKLLQAGVITDKLWHGSNSSYEVWLNTNLLSIEPNMFVQQTTFTATETTAPEFLNSAPSVDFSEKQKFPHTDNLSSNKKTNNNIKIDHFSVKNSDLRTQNIEKQQETFDEKCGIWNVSVEFPDNFVEKSVEIPRKHSQEPDKEADIKRGNSELTTKSAEITANLPQKSMGIPQHVAEMPSGKLRPNKAEILRKRLINDFWISAKKRLYANTYLTEYAEACALKKIEIFYQMSTPDKLEHHHKTYLRRLIHAENYVKRSPETRFIPIPNIYFDIKNKNGFGGTAAWDRAWLDRKLNIKARNTYSKAMQAFKRNRLKGEMAPIENFRRSEQRIGKLGNEVLLQQFYQEVIELNNKNEAQT